MSNRSRCRRAMFVVLVIALPSPSIAVAADLTSLMPDKTLLYVGFSGSDATRQARSETAFGKTLADPEVATFTKTVYRVVDALLARQAKKESATTLYESVKRLAVAVATRPVAFGLHDFGINQQSGPFVEAALIVETGEGAASMVTDLEAVLTANGITAGMTAPIDGRNVKMIPLPIPGGVYYGADAGHFFIAVSKAAVRSVHAGAAGIAENTLKTNAALRQAQSRIGGEAESRAAMLHVNVSRLYGIVKPFIPMFTQGDMKLAERIQTGLEQLGVPRVLSVTAELHYRFDGFVTSGYLQTDGPPLSLAFARKTGHVSDAELGLIPGASAWAIVTHVDLASTWSKLLSLIDAIDSDAHAEMMSDLADLEEDCGLNARTELIDQLGHSLIVYAHPSHSVGLLFPQGIVGSIDTAEPARITRALQKLTACADRDSHKSNIALDRMTYRGHDVYYLGVDVPSPVAPAFTTHGGRFYFALYPQVLKAVIDYLEDADRAEDSLLANAQFNRGRLVVGESSSVTWSQPDAGFDGVYTLLLPLATMGVGAAKGEGVDVDLSCIPSARAFSRRMFGQVSATSWDEHGVLAQWYGPLPPPLPWLASQSGVGVASIAVLVSILLPSLARARELSKRLVCASNMKGIGMAMLIEMNDHPTSGTPTLKSLIANGDIPAKQLICPSGGDANYIQVPLTQKQLETSRGDEVWMYEPIENHDGEGGNILFTDGHVRFVRADEYNRLIASITKRRRE